jgi:hypothetical protein
MKITKLASKPKNKEPTTWPSNVNKLAILIQSYTEIKPKVIPAQSAEYSSICEMTS